MKKKIEKTKQEQDAHNAIVRFNRMYAGLKRTIKTQCAEGLRSVELQLAFLKDHPNTKMPKPEFSHSQLVQCYSEAIEEYKESKETIKT